MKRRTRGRKGKWEEARIQDGTSRSMPWHGLGVRSCVALDGCDGFRRARELRGICVTDTDTDHPASPLHAHVLALAPGPNLVSKSTTTASYNLPRSISPSGPTTRPGFSFLFFSFFPFFPPFGKDASYLACPDVLIVLFDTSPEVPRWPVSPDRLRVRPTRQSRPPTTATTTTTTATATAIAIISIAA